MSEENKLLPCPFCGSNELTECCDDYNVERLYCKDCQCSHTRENWNTRASQWISVKEKLPQNHKIVLAITEEGEQAVSKFDKTEWEYFFMLNLTSYQMRKVTHWMPLPIPPKETKNEHK